jgi:hypothetical protein
MSLGRQRAWQAELLVPWAELPHGLLVMSSMTSSRWFSSGGSYHGDMRRVWLRGGENIQKRYLIHVTRHNLG